MPKGSFLRNATPEQRAAMQAKRIATLQARKAGEAKVKETRLSSYKIHPDTDEYWAGLAKEKGVRLPHKSTEMTRTGLVTFLHKIGMSLAQHRELTGLQMKEYLALTAPRFPLRAGVGFALELQSLHS